MPTEIQSQSTGTMSTDERLENPSRVARIEVRGTPQGALAGASIGFFIGFAAVSLFGPTSRYLQTAGGLSAALAGVLISIPNLTGSLLRVPFSAMVDRDGGRRPFLVLLTLSLVGVVGVAAILLAPGVDVARAFPLLLFFGALGGCGSATFSVGISQTSYWFPAEVQGRALGTYAGLGNLAPGVFAFLLSTLAIPYLGIGGAYVAWAFLLLGGIVLYAKLGRNAYFFQYRAAGVSDEQARTAAAERGQAFFPRGSAWQTLQRSARTWQTWALVGVYFVTFGGFMGLTAWFPTYWSSVFGMEVAAAGRLAAGYAVGASLLRVVGGRLSDRFGGARTAEAVLIGMAVAAAAMALSRSVPAALLAMVGMAATMGIANAAVFKLVPRVVPDAIGGAAGWIGGLGAFGGFVLPNVFAAIGAVRGFFVLALLALGGLLLIVVVDGAARRAERRAARQTQHASAVIPGGTR